MDFEAKFNKIGKCFFVKYFEYFKNGYTGTSMLDIVEEPYTKKAIITRTNKARTIILAGIEKEALEFIVNAIKMQTDYPDTVYRAKELLKTYYPESKIDIDTNLNIKKNNAKKKKSNIVSKRSSPF